MHGDVEAVVGEARVPRAERVDQLPAAHAAFESRDERSEQAELARRELERRVVDVCATARQVEAKAAELHLGHSLCRAAAEQCTDARFELAERERLHEVIVGTEIERAHALVERLARS